MRLKRDREYKIDTLFKNREALIKSILPIQNKYDYEGMFKEYYDLLKEEKYDGFPLPTNIPIGKSLEYFDKKIFITNDSYYKVVWFIDQLKEQIKEYGIKPVDVPTDLLVWASGTNEIDPTHVENVAPNDEPVIVGMFPCLTPPLVLIDGNHRVLAKAIKGDPTVKAYVLQPQQLVDTIGSNYIRKIAIMHHNVFGMLNYMAGNLSEEAFKDGLLVV